MTAKTPRIAQPCHHKRANHQHGTYAAYVLDKCRCQACTDAVAAKRRDEARQQAYGRWQPYVDAEPVRAHLHKLQAAGIGWRRAAELAGLRTSTVCKLLYGYGDRGPSKNVRPPTAEKILAVPMPALADIAAGNKVDATSSRRRMQALVALGWTQTRLAARLGLLPSNFGRIVHSGGDAKVLASTARAAHALYDELSMRLPPTTTSTERTAAARARSYAKKRGWLPPLAYDDIDHPDSNDQATDETGEYLDHAAINRRAAGDWKVRLTPAEAKACIDQLRALGHSWNQVYEITHLNVQRHTRTRIHGQKEAA